MKMKTVVMKLTWAEFFKVFVLYCIYGHVRAIPTYRFYRLYDDIRIPSVYSVYQALFLGGGPGDKAMMGYKYDASIA